MRSTRALPLAALGYVIAVCVAVVVTEAVMLAPAALPDDGRNGSIFAFLPDLPGVFVVGFFWTFLCALPGFVVAVILGERRSWSHWLSYAAAGTLNVVPSLAIFSGLAGPPFSMPLMIVGAFIGGFAGGAAYWAGAGRFVARRRIRG